MFPVGFLYSLGITPILRYYEAFRHPLVFDSFPVCAVIESTFFCGFPHRTRRASPVPSMSLSPCCCCHPVGMSHRISQFSVRHAAFVRCRSGLGFRDFNLTRYHRHSLALRPGDLLAIPKMTLSMGFRALVSLRSAIRATGFRLFPWWD